MDSKAQTVVPMLKLSLTNLAPQPSLSRTNNMIDLRHTGFNLISALSLSHSAGDLQSQGYIGKSVVSALQHMLNS